MALEYTDTPVAKFLRNMGGEGEENIKKTIKTPSLLNSDN